MGSRRALAALAVLAAVLVVGGAALVLLGGRSPSVPSGAPPRSGCGAVVTEPLDPRSLQHLLPDAPDPAFDRLPPTSGPHAPTVLSGVQPGPLPAVVQVGLLEAGRVLVQYRPGGAGRVPAEALAGPAVVVAPAPTLGDDVVATAWRHRLRCTTPDPAALAAFITRFEGKGFGA